MPVHEDLPPELRHADAGASGPEPVATRFFSSRSTHRTVAWVVIAAMFLVPFGVSLVSVLFG